jgi:hypothetical protein
MMQRNDPYVNAWVEAAAALPASACALEIGAAFGVASLQALQRGARVTVNDLDARHIAEVERRWHSVCTRERRAHLSTLEGAVPSVLAQWRPPGPLKAVLAANLLHFLPPDDTIQVLARLHGLCSAGARLFVSVDSPWSAAYRPLWPLHALRKQLLREPFPGAHDFRERPLLRRLMLPTRLSAATFYHVMEPAQLAEMLERSGWQRVRARAFDADEAGNPAGVTLGNGMEMTGAEAVKT